MVDSLIFFDFSCVRISILLTGYLFMTIYYLGALDLDAKSKSTWLAINMKLIKIGLEDITSPGGDRKFPFEKYFSPREEKFLLSKRTCNVLFII